MINTSNPGNLQISQSRNSIEFNVLENKVINARVTGNYTVSGKVLHSWIAQTPASDGLTMEDNSTLGSGSASSAGVQSPLVTPTNATIATNTPVLVRQRNVHNTYGVIWEVVGGVAGSTATNSTSNEMCLASITSTSVDSRGFWQATAYTKDGTETWYVSGTAWWDAGAASSGSLGTSGRPQVPVYIIGTRPQPSPSYTDNPRIVSSPNWYMLPILWPAILNYGWNQAGGPGPFKAQFELVQVTNPASVQSPTTGAGTYHGATGDPGFILNIPYEGNLVWAANAATSGMWPTNVSPGGRGIMGCFHGIGWIPVSGKPIWQGNLYAPITGATSV